jgi:transposase-like protein
MNIIQIYKKFPDQKACIAHLEQVRWNGVPICPYCKSKKQTPAPKENRYHCNTCNTTYSVTVGTIFHKTKCDLQKWFLAITLVLNAKKGISARQLARDIEVTKDTAWYMIMRIRKAFTEYGDLLEGIIEADETYIGGKNKNRHSDKKTEGGQGRGGDDKTPVIGLVQRDGKIVAQKAKNVTKRTLHAFINENVKKGSKIMTDEWASYNGLSAKFSHMVVSHGKGEYVQGECHTNTMENFWSILKRGIIGQYHQVSRKHLNAYISEFVFRHNHRDNAEIFNLTLLNAVSYDRVSKWSI